MGADANVLSEMPLFRDLSAPDLAVVAGMLEDLTLDGGALLFKQGAWAASMFVVAEGVVEILGESEATSDRVLATIQPGSCLGEMALVRDQQRSRGARAGRKGARLWVLKRDHLDVLARTSPLLWGRLFKNIAAILADRVESLDHELERRERERSADEEKGGGGLFSRLWGG